MENNNLIIDTIDYFTHDTEEDYCLDNIIYSGYFTLKQRRAAEILSEILKMPILCVKSLINNSKKITFNVVEILTNTPKKEYVRCVINKFYEDYSHKVIQFCEEIKNNLPS